MNESLSYSEAISRNQNQVEKEQFKEAYHKEMDTLDNMETWDSNPISVEVVDNNMVINSMFIFTTKRRGKRKCRLVARGDLQGDMTYNHILITNTVHHYALMTCLSHCLNNDYYVVQLDNTRDKSSERYNEQHCKTRFGL